MPLPGGASDKYGNRYEDLWTAQRLTYLMDETVDEIRLEPPGEEGAGVEFWVSSEGRREYHQVKRQNGAEGRWTLGDIHSNGVLTSFWEKLQEATARCVFVSTEGVQYLKEFVERARAAASWQEFEREFLQPPRQQRAFSTLRGYWKACSSADAYEALRRITIHTISEELLRTQVEQRLNELVVCDPPRDVLALIIQFAHDNVHQTLIPQDIWRSIESQSGCQRRQIESDPHVLAAISGVTDAFAAPLRKILIAGEMIGREEADQVIRLLQQQNLPHGVLLTGEAGTGKSHVALQVVDALQTAGWPVFAFESDALASARRPEDVGEQLLHRRLSPVDALARIAHDRPCLLVIDQIDNLNRISGPDSASYECFEAMLDRAFEYPHLCVLLTCRTFDLDNDDRLKRLKKRTTHLQIERLGRLPEATVRSIITRLGLNADRLTEKQISLLTIPLHLYLLEGIAQDANRQALDFGTVEDLYDRYWEYKRRRIHKRQGVQSTAWTDIIDALVKYMSERQRLSVPAYLLDRFATDAEAMTSEHILVLQDKRYTFFHEEFFDYAFARRFTAEQRGIVPFLEPDDQRLFRRAQVRHILAYQRHAGADEREAYLTTLRDVLTETGIRFHLKQAALDMLKAIDNPWPEEWRILEPLIEGQDEGFATGILQAIDDSLPWFTLLDQLDVLQRWLAEERFAQKALILLTGVQRLLPDRVAELVESYAEDFDWRSRFVWLMNLCEIGASLRFFQLLLRLIDVGALDEARAALAANGDFWLLVYDLPATHPEWACDVIGHYLSRRLTLSTEAGQPNPFDRDTGSIRTSVGSEGYVLRAAQGAPSAFVEHILPFMLEVMNLTARQTGEAPWKDAVWANRYIGAVYGLDQELLNAMAVALRILASEAPDKIRVSVSRLHESAFETAQYLLVKGYAGNGSLFADEAVEYLCGHQSRLALGYLSEPHWATRELVEAVTPHCSAIHLMRLEQTLLNYYPPFEKSAKGRQQQGLAQLTLLKGIARDRRSPAVNKRLGELQRKFGETAKDQARPTIASGWVASPISESAVEKMSDKQWLRAIARYDDEKVRTERSDAFTGGSDHLAVVLQRQVKRNPSRFARLLCQFPDATNLVYFNGVLRGLIEAEATLDDELLVAVAQRCHQLPGRPCGKELPRFLAKYAARALSPEVLDIVAWYATEDPDPDQELWRTPVPGGGVYYGGDMFNAGINSVRGEAARVIADLISADEPRIAYFASTLDHLVTDSSLSVRSCAAVTITVVFQYEPERGLALFLQLCNAEDEMLKTSHVQCFLFSAVRSSFLQLLPIIRRMLSSALPEVELAGARAACIAALVTEEAGALIDECLTGTPVQRCGAAQIFAANLRDASCRGVCEAALSRLMEDAEVSVREDVAKSFTDFRAEDVAGYRSFIEGFTQSAAFAADPFPLLRVLMQAGLNEPALTCLVCERFLDVTGDALTDIRTYASSYAHRIGELLAQVYRDTSDDAMRMRSLSLMERMSRSGVQGINQLLESLER